MNWGELVNTVTASPFFGIALTFLTFEVGLLLRRKWKIALLTPFLISVVLICLILVVTRIPYENYNQGGQIISHFMGPATVILAVPVYRQLKLLKKNLLPVLGGVLLGALASFFSTYLLALLLRVDSPLFLSLVPHSVTTPISTALSEQIGGIGSLSVLALMISGNIGAALAPYFKKWFRVHDPVAHGVATGSCSHVLGTATAAKQSEVEGAFSGLSIGVAGFVTVLLVPILLQFFSI